MFYELENTSDVGYAIEVNCLNKCYQIYNQPSDRLKQILMLGRNQYYKEFWALKDVSFKVKKGETIGIIGRNGSGKSTLLQIICGTLNPTSGEVRVRGRVAALLELGAGFNPEFSGVENIYMAASLYGLSKELVDQRFEEIAAFADIGDHIHQPVKTYSSGMYVRLAFAVIAHVDADILIVDEALAVGDVVFTQKCMRFIRKFKENGTLLFVSHDIAAVTSICDNAILLSHGVAITRGSSKTVVEKYMELNYQQTQMTDMVLTKKEKNIEVVNKKPKTHNDMRRDLINSSNLRNDIKVFSFNENAKVFGAGGAELERIHITDSDGKPLNYLVGGEEVVLEIAFKTLKTVKRPIIGFTVKDRLGQSLFVDNTYISHAQINIEANNGQILVARFAFILPILPAGRYTVSPAIADGTYDEHTQLKWIHDAMILEVQASSVCIGLIGLTMQKIELTIE